MPRPFRDIPIPAEVCEDDVFRIVAFLGTGQIQPDGWFAPDELRRLADFVEKNSSEERT